MDELRLQAVAACVVAWHNRHPLARRITRDHIQAIGYVALPYVAAGSAAEPTLEAPLDAAAPAPAADVGEGATLREGAAAQAPQGEAPAATGALARGALRPAFSEDFIAPVSTRRVARWAARRGSRLTPAPDGAPLRVVQRLASVPGVPVTVHLLSAAIETGTLRARVLVGAGERAAVLGPRLWSGPRVAAAAVLPLLLSAALLTLSPWPRTQGSEAATAAASAPSAVVAAASEPSAVMAAASAPSAAMAAASEPSAAMAAASAPLAAMAAASVPVAASAAAMIAPTTAEAAASAVPVVLAQAAEPHPEPRPAAKADGKAAVPVDVAPRLGKLNLPLISDEDKAEARRVRRARDEALAAGLPASNAVTAAAGGKGEPPPAGSQAAPAFALSTRVLRTRAEAEQVRVAMDALLRTVKASEIHTDILPQGDDWRVVGWPFARRDLAEQARTLLVARGMRVEIVAF